MTMPTRGSRKIVVEGTAYRWHVSRWKKVSGWKPADLGLLDPAWVEAARRVGLGDVAEGKLTIAIELHQAPASCLRITYLAKAVDGFLGIEQLSSVTPSLVVTLIAHARLAGWEPAKGKNHDLTLVENTGSARRPALLVLPGWNDVPGYEPRVVWIEIPGA